MSHISYNWRMNMKRMPVIRKIVYICLIMLAIRIVTNIPLPFINQDYIKTITNSVFSNGIIGAMTGSSFEKMGFFALSISPYITATIIVQLLTICIPALEEMTKDGEAGQEKYKKVMNWTGAGLAAFQAAAMVIGYGKNGLITPYRIPVCLLIWALWTAGASVLIAVGNFIEYFGIGSGVSFLLLTNIVSTIPDDVKTVYSLLVKGKSVGQETISIAAFVGVFVLIVAACTVMVTTTRDIKIIYSNKTNGRVMASKSVLPIPLVTCNVMPVIFASSLCAAPSIIVSIANIKNEKVLFVTKLLSPSSWFNSTQPYFTAGLVIYVLLTYFFTDFYLMIAFNASEIAANLKRSGAMIAGVRPGKPTEKVLHDTILETALWGNTLLVGLIAATYAITGLTGLGSMSMSSTSAIIAVSIMNEILEKVESEFTVRNIHKNASIFRDGKKRASELKGFPKTADKRPA